jgi:AhpD family alkylhydroperoxidase
MGLKEQARRARGELMDAPMAEFYKAHLSGDGALDFKTKELIALAFSYGNKCQACIKHHKAIALKAGMTEEEYRELVAVCEVTAAGGVLMDFGTTESAR